MSGSGVSGDAVSGFSTWLPSADRQDIAHYFSVNMFAKSAIDVHGSGIGIEYTLVTVQAMIAMAFKSDDCMASLVSWCYT
jgi:hypothetical protein